MKDRHYCYPGFSCGVPSPANPSKVFGARLALEALSSERKDATFSSAAACCGTGHGSSSLHLCTHNFMHRKPSLHQTPLKELLRCIVEVEGTPPAEPRKQLCSTSTPSSMDVKSALWWALCRQWLVPTKLTASQPQRGLAVVPWRVVCQGWRPRCVQSATRVTMHGKQWPRASLEWVHCSLISLFVDQVVH